MTVPVASVVICPNFGACGGEDLDLFLRLERRGCRCAWCAEAGVLETIPSGRMSLSYHQLRASSGWGKLTSWSRVRLYHVERPSA